MRPLRLGWASFPIPFRAAFAHASATRREAQNILVRVEDADGLVGFGEGCPRSYVTGETVASAAAALSRWSDALRESQGVEDLRGWLEDARTEVDAAPSAACAAELALLDLFARRAGEPVEDLLETRRLSTPLNVTAVYGATPAAVFLLQHLRFARAGMADAKLKLTGDARLDGARAARLARRGSVRLDANNLWASADSALAGLSAAASHAWAVEEPIAARDWTGLARVGRGSGLALILDESFGAPADLDRLEGGPRYLVNLRPSHLGGMLRTLEAVSAAQARGVEVIVGAHVGETSLLARAGLAAAAAVGPHLRGYEGAYGTWLLARDLFAPSLTFGRDGRVVPGREWRPEAAGWGLRLGQKVEWRDL